MSSGLLPAPTHTYFTFTVILVHEKTNRRAHQKTDKQNRTWGMTSFMSVLLLLGHADGLMPLTAFQIHPGMTSYLGRNYQTGLCHKTGYLVVSFSPLALLGYNCLVVSSTILSDS